MSLLDDVSIVVTPNAYTAGRLYGVLPTATEGSEEVTNGGFDTDSDWSGSGSNGWTISGGKASNDGTVGSNNLSQSGILVVGKQYKIDITVSNYVSGNVEVSAGAVPRGTMTADGTYTFYQTCTPSTTFYIIANSFDGSVDNVSVKEFTASDMDVTRATAATRVDENGLVNYAEVLGSEEVTNGDFATDSDWSKLNGSTISGGVGNVIANGSLSSTGSNWSLNQDVGMVLGSTYKISFRARQTGGTGNFQVGQAYDLGFNQIITSSFVNYTFYISVTNDYGANTGKITIGGETSGDTFEVDNVSVKEADRDNVPRIDYTGGGCPHILAEPQRTNLITYSEDFSDSSWTKVASGIDTSIGTDGINPNVEISPDGTQNADRVNFILQSNKDNGMYEIISASAGNSYTTSVYLKGEGVNIGKTIKVRIKRLSGGSFVTVDIDYVLTSEWFRLELNPLTLLSGNTNAILIFTSNDATNCLIYGCQVEEGSYPTSYIPTSGSTVTRNQDVFTRDGIGSLINSTEGVLFVEMAALSDDGTNRVISLYSDSNNRVSIFYSTTSNTIFGQYVISGSSTASLSFALSDTTLFSKIAFKYKENDFALWVDGVEVGTDTSGLVLSANTLNNLDFNLGNSTLPFFGKVKQLQVYDTALTDAQLTSLTS